MELCADALQAMQAYLDKNPDVVALIREMSDEEKRKWIDEECWKEQPHDDDEYDWPEETNMHDVAAETSEQASQEKTWSPGTSGAWDQAEWGNDQEDKTWTDPVPNAWHAWRKEKQEPQKWEKCEDSSPSDREATDVENKMSTGSEARVPAFCDQSKNSDIPDVAPEVAEACLQDDGTPQAHAFKQKLLAAEKREIAMAKKKSKKKKGEEDSAAEPGEKEKPAKEPNKAPKCKKTGQPLKEPKTEYMARKRSFFAKKLGGTVGSVPSVYNM
ncbi:unnamed protein product [Symbiodinium sp. CCMP2592]|nr:unnamed protein product [Symbiodinium sp. CCMP2592]